MKYRHTTNADDWHPAAASRPKSTQEEETVDILRSMDIATLQGLIAKAQAVLDEKTRTH